MKKLISLLLALSILIFSGCRNAVPAGENYNPESSTPTTYQTDPVIDNSGPVFTDPEIIHSNTESVSQTESWEETKYDSTTSTGDIKPEGKENENEYKR